MKIWRLTFIYIFSSYANEGGRFLVQIMKKYFTSLLVQHLIKYSINIQLDVLKVFLGNQFFSADEVGRRTRSMRIASVAPHAPDILFSAINCEKQAWRDSPDTNEPASQASYS